MSVHRFHFASDPRAILISNNQNPNFRSLEVERFA